MSTDKMQDVFPISFDFKKGEQPTATKLTGFVKQVDTAFTSINRAIGDPWEYTAHIYNLSPERLAQASLARFIGPSDWASPKGASWNEVMGTDISVTLEANRNTWSLGFPLTSVSSDLDPDADVSGHIAAVSWAGNVTVVTDTGSVLDDEVSLLDLVQEAGDFHVDYLKGVITAYKPSTSAIHLTITGMHMFGPGVPWGTANIIPTWNQTASLCAVTWISTVGGVSTYDIALPTVDEGTRSTGALIGALEPYNSLDAVQSTVNYTSVSCSGETADYRLPYAITSAFSANDEIPDGFMYLWDNNQSRILSQITFYYRDEQTVRVTTPEDWLTVTGSNYRLIVTGTSLAEAVGYLFSSTRDNRHVGLAECQDTKTLMYTSPLSHDHLADLYTGDLTGFTSDVDYRFRKSDYPTNPHPQYLHRCGYLEDDADGNSANAIRGWLMFNDGNVSSSTYTYGSTSVLTAINGVGLCWGTDATFYYSQTAPFYFMFVSSGTTVARFGPSALIDASADVYITAGTTMDLESVSHTVVSVGGVLDIDAVDDITIDSEDGITIHSATACTIGTDTILVMNAVAVDINASAGLWMDAGTGMAITTAAGDLDLVSASGDVGIAGNNLNIISGSYTIIGVPAGATQVAAGAAVSQLWRTNGHATLPDGVLMIGI